ncbi:nucleotidyltransferase family protein [Coleofasciculus sp. FACHB-1120]|uniref:nucleotidyltransferase family protein n=1 Tax=Coleofasciculus sp. FACHB-1120 TaxID=2692783 RepID=UPI00168357AF|nr:nucleotidyltransferase family protein [Coleofasciculus sp. FACHB-1120]MBD2743906.1 nucleotidyltransferase family protein [Coleofasciculus sp. FACHB-1120]
MNAPVVGLIILAAGASTRMGTPKQLLLYQGRSFLRHTAEIAIASLCQPIVVVLGANAEQIKPEVSELPIQIVENPQWAEGMSSSIRVGIEALDNLNQSLDAVAIALCDQPFISSQLLNQIVEAYQVTRRPIIASEYAGSLGVPALFSRALFPELMSLKTTEGAKQIIKKHSPEVFRIPFPGGAIDIDTPKDYQEFQALADESLQSRTGI